ncbi:galactokinase [Nocardioides sp.]|uniref:galactokinase n=1 Tax=Nocardioides sp. TaxID=35761 RepID=UPI0035154E09
MTDLPTPPAPGRRVVARAPGRVNLVGEHTDYNGGLCLPFALDLATTATVTTRADTRVRLLSSPPGASAPMVWEGDLADCRPGGVRGWAAYVAGVLWATAQDGQTVPGVNVAVTSTVPLGAGLSSSAALTVAVALALDALAGHTLDDDRRAVLVERCRRAEAEVAGAPTGGLDQQASLRGRAGHGVLLDFGAGTARPVPLAWEEDGLRLIVVDTRVSHALTDGGYATRRAECEAAAAALGVATLSSAAPEALAGLTDPVLRRRARHVVTEDARVREVVAGAAARGWRTVGAAMTASHASLRTDFEVSCAELDLGVQTALDAGALGARMTGGGFGGSFIALVPAPAVEGVRTAIDTAFAQAGHRAPDHHDGVPAPGAQLVSI